MSAAERIHASAYAKRAFDCACSEPVYADDHAARERGCCDDCHAAQRAADDLVLVPALTPPAELAELHEHPSELEIAAEQMVALQGARLADERATLAWARSLATDTVMVTPAIARRTVMALAGAR